MPSTVTVHYPFHALFRRQLQVIRWPRLNSGATTVLHPDGNTIKIPLWMLQPESTRFQHQPRIELSASALLSLVDLLSSYSSSKVNTEKQSEQTSEASRDALQE